MGGCGASGDPRSRAGRVDLITDGEISRTEFIGRLLGCLRNLEVARPALRQTGQPSYDSVPTFRTTGKLSLDPRAGFGILAEWEFARRIATHSLKVSVPGPYTLAAYIQPGEGYASWSEIVWDLAALVNGEARQLAAAGVPFVQIDEPLVVQEGNHGAYHGDTKLAVDVLNRTLAGVAARTGLTRVLRQQSPRTVWSAKVCRVYRDCSASRWTSFCTSTSTGAWTRSSSERLG